MSPQALVEHKAFKDLITGISRIKAPITVMTSKTLSKRIDKDYLSLVQAMIEKIQSVKYICTTADVWSSSRRSYMCITAHWVRNIYKKYSSILI